MYSPFLGSCAMTDTHRWEIPEFPDFRKVSLSDREHVEALFDRYPTEVSERTFGTIYVWRGYAGRSRLSTFEGHLMVSWRREQFGNLLLPPIGPRPAETIVSIRRTAREHGFAGFFCLTEPAVSALRENGLTPESLRDEWDYVYMTRDLIALEGPGYHTQRKELKKVASQNAVKFEVMTREHLESCLQLEEVWCDLKRCTFDRLSAAEDAALKEALLNYDALGFIGGVVLMNGKVEALTVGERLSPNTAVVHFEKANPGIRGLYQFINQQFCEHVLKDFEFVNREQDVGEPGLRRAKEGYRPHHFVEKHVLGLA